MGDGAIGAIDAADTPISPGAREESSSPGSAREPLSAAPFSRMVRVAGSGACQGTLPAAFWAFEQMRSPSRPPVSVRGSRRRPAAALVLCLALALAGAAGCRKRGPAPPVAEPIDALLARGQAPVEVTVAPQPGITPIPRYPATLRNLSDRPITAVRYTVLFYGADGAQLPDGKQVVGFSNTLRPIPPGGTWSGPFLSPVAGAARAKAVVREVVYLPAAQGAPGTEATREWKNPRHDVEVTALERSGPGSSQAAAPAPPPPGVR